MIVLDTDVWYWWASGQPARLSQALLDTLAVAPTVGVSPVSCFEVAGAYRRGRLELPLPVAEWFVEALERSDVELLPLTSDVAARAAALTALHSDPFDRIIIATALEWDGQLASADGQFAAYPELAGRLLV